MTTKNATKQKTAAAIRVSNMRARDKKLGLVNLKCSAGFKNMYKRFTNEADFITYLRSSQTDNEKLVLKLMQELHDVLIDAEK